MPVDCVSDEPRPEPRRRVGCHAHGGGCLGDEPDGALSDRVEVVIVRRAGGVVQSDAFGAAKLAEGMRHETALSVGVEHADARPWQRAAV